MRLKTVLILALGLWAAATTAAAQPAALTASQLKSAADLIATGRVIATKRIGPFYTIDHCHMWQNYLADFEIESTVKGSSAKTIQVFVPYIVRELYPQKPCLQNDYGTLWLEPGLKYQLFLKTSPHADPAEFRLFHPSGLVPIKP